MLASESVRRDAFTALFSQMSPRLYRTALGILGNPHDASDALQEAGIKAYRYFDRLQQSEAGPAWITRILINACYDVGRRRARTTPIGLDVEREEATAVPEETDWELVQALQALGEEQRTTVVLRFFQDLTVPQIAGVMNVPEGTVKSRLHAALSRMRGLLIQSRKEGVR